MTARTAMMTTKISIGCPPLVRTRYATGRGGRPARRHRLFHKKTVRFFEYIFRRNAVFGVRQQREIAARSSSSSWQGLCRTALRIAVAADCNAVIVRKWHGWPKHSLSPISGNSTTQNPLFPRKNTLSHLFNPFITKGVR